MPPRPDDASRPLAMRTRCRLVDSIKAVAAAAHEGVSSEDLAEALGVLEMVKVRLWARLLQPPRGQTRTKETRTLQLLSVKEAAQRLHCSPMHLYRNQADLPFIRKVGRSVRCDARALEEWVALQKG